MRRSITFLASLALTVTAFASQASADTDPGYECDNQFGACGTPEQSGGGGGGGGGSILVDRTDYGDTYQFADDYDSDGLEDNFDNCPRATNNDQADGDGDGVGDACDTCLDAANPDQSNIDGDAFGDLCDDDIDGDDVLNAEDNCETLPNPTMGSAGQADMDGNGVGDACDDDIDGDGMPNLEDSCPANASISDPSADQMEQCFPDLDGDNFDDIRDDNCPGYQNPDQIDTDTDGMGDACDADLDEDGFQNFQDNCPGMANTDQFDGDRDGKGNGCDTNFCFVVFGDAQNCLDPSASLDIYSPSFVGVDTGERFMPRLFANRQNQAMRYTWSVASAPDGSAAVVDNPTGTVTISTPYEYRYLDGEAPAFQPDMPGTYELQVTVETVFEDRVSLVDNETATHRMTLEAEGDPVEPNSSSDGAACSVTSTRDTAPAGAWLALLGLGFIGWARRRKL